MNYMVSIVPLVFILSALIINLGCYLSYVLSCGLFGLLKNEGAFFYLSLLFPEVLFLYQRLREGLSGKAFEEVGNC